MNTFVIIGAGQAGAWVARSLRNSAFKGRIVLIGDEDAAPYERPPLSTASPHSVASSTLGTTPAAITTISTAKGA